jgi:hypothetical protein
MALRSVKVRGKASWNLGIRILSALWGRPIFSSSHVRFKSRVAEYDSVIQIDVEVCTAWVEMGQHSSG